SSGGGSLTMTGQAVGTAQYMSPEQAAGDKTLDERADIYSLGVIGFEMLTGRTPFAGSSTLEIVARRMAEETPSVRTIRPDVPQKMADVISRCLEKLPERRWGSASEMLAYLD
ncbi:MAG: protein kinase, partial [Gemmatimonadales bacterium]